MFDAAREKRNADHNLEDRYPRFHGIGLPLLAFLYPVTVAVTQKGFVYDPFILMRYGENLADGLGWNFNPGSPSNSAVTSPLYVLLIAAGAVIGVSPEPWSLLLYTLAWGLGGLVLAHIMFADGRRVAGWLACAFYTFSPLLVHVRGMETPVYLLLLLTAIWTWQRQRWLTLGCLLGLLALARTDGALVGAALVAWLAWRHPHRRLLSILGPSLAIVVSWTAVLWALTGSPMPSTLAAKLAQRDAGGGFLSQLGYLQELTGQGVTG